MSEDKGRLREVIKRTEAERDFAVEQLTSVSKRHAAGVRQIRAVRKLHVKVEGSFGFYCDHCATESDNFDYPCPTIRALDGGDAS